MTGKVDINKPMPHINIQYFVLVVLLVFGDRKAAEVEISCTIMLSFNWELRKFSGL